jgi:phenylacetate-CoA ligase
MERVADGFVPRVGICGARWPAVPGEAEAAVLSLYHQLAQTQWLSPEALAARQLSQLRALVSHAVEAVPWYRKHFAPRLAGPPAQLTWDDWARLPVLPPEALAANQAGLVSASPPPGHGEARPAAIDNIGGRPVHIMLNGVSDVFDRAIALRFYDWWDWDVSGVLMEFRSIGRPGVQRHDNWGNVIKSGARVVCDASPDAAALVAAVRREQPDYLALPVADFARLVRAWPRRGGRPRRLKAVVVDGPVLPAALRRVGERRLQAPIIHRLSLPGLGAIALPCPEQGVHHLMSECFVSDLIAAPGAPATGLVTGRLVLSALQNYAMPLLRLVTLLAIERLAACACGRGLSPFKVLEA